MLNREDMNKIYFYLLIAVISTVLWGCANNEATSSKTKESNNKTATIADKVRDTKENEFIASQKDTNLQEVSLNELKAKKVDGKDLMFYKDELFTGNAVYNMKNGNPFTLNGYKNGLKHGYYATWYANGNKQQEGFYNNGLQDSINLEYYETGEKQREHHWINGKKNGAWLSWYESGAKWTHRDFKNDQLHGKIYVWDEDGVLGKEYDYNNGVLTNQIMHFENNQ